MIGGVLHGGPSGHPVPEASVRIAEIQVERCEKASAAVICHSLGMLNGQRIPMQGRGGRRLMAREEMRRDGCLEVVAPSRPGLLEEAQCRVCVPFHCHALCAQRDHRIRGIHKVGLSVLRSDARDHQTPKVELQRIQTRVCGGSRKSSIIIL